MRHSIECSWVSRTPRSRFVASLSFWASLLPTLAVPAEIIPTVPGSGVSITVQRWGEGLASHGFANVRVHIQNHSKSHGVWTLSTNPSYGETVEYSRDFSVEDGKDREFEVLLPCPLNQQSYRNLYCTIRGPGIAGSSGFGWASGSSSGEPFVAVSNAFDASTELLRRTPYRFELEEMPSDWRGYLGWKEVWLDQKDWISLTQAKKTALLDWVARGGHAIVNAGKNAAESLKAPRGSKGSLSPILSPDEEDNMLSGYIGSDYRNVQEISGSWGLGQVLDRIKLRTLLIFGFIVLFGLVAGPVNLFWFAPSGRRHRLIWTTPLISLIGSLILGLLILVQDGIGGTGARLVHVRILPDDQKHLIAQEQISKTGLLLGRSFSISEPVWIHYLKSDRGNGGGDTLKMQQDETRYSGDWFKSRAMQAHYLETIRASRGVIEFMPGNPPSILSSLESELSQVQVSDEEGKTWIAENVGIGEKKTLRAGSPLKLEAVKLAGPMIARELSTQKSGWFIAEAKDPAKFSIETLGSIRWKHQHVIITGPYVKRP